MVAAELDLMAGLLGETEVMMFYPRPKARDEALRWIEWSQALYAAHGYGLWIVETATPQRRLAHVWTWRSA